MGTDTKDNYQVITKKVPTFYFVGVTTSKSSIMKVFPLWMKVLGREEVVIEGIDCAIHADPEVYRQAVAQMKYDPLSLGALVTTHKIDLLTAARDMFDYLDPYAQITDEISSISKLEGRLEGHAKDPITSGLSLDAIIDQGYFGRTGGDVLSFGAGGSAIATLLHLINKKDKGDRPKRFTFVNRSQGRLDHAKEMVGGLKTDIEVEYIQNSDPAVNDKIMEKFPPHSVIINATGMGKDTPGSRSPGRVNSRWKASPGSSITAASWISCTRRSLRWKAAKFLLKTAGFILSMVGRRWSPRCCTLISPRQSSKS